MHEPEDTCHGNRVNFLWFLHISILYCLVPLLLLALSVNPARSEESESIPTEADADQSDIYYDAMIRSIELDTSRWKSFSRSMESGPWFYDAQGLKRNNGKVTVPVTVYPHPNRTEIYSSVYPEHTRIRKIEFVTEINCSKRTYRQPQIRVHGYFNELLAEHSSEGTQMTFSPIKPGTTTDTLRSLVCTPDRKKRK
jgi:hypothetical protein